MDKIKNFTKIKHLISLSLILAFIIMVIPISYSATINIEEGQNNEGIQNLIDNAQSGDIIQFHNSTYNEISLIIDKNLTLKGNGASILTNNSQGVIHQNQVRNEVNGEYTFGFYFTKNSIGSIFEGFNIFSNSDYAIIADSTTITLSSNNISENTTNENQKGIILFENNKNSEIQNTKVINSKGNGIEIKNSINILLFSNNIVNCLKSGVFIYNSSDLKLEKNIIIDNLIHGIEISLSNKTFIINNTVENNYDGISLSNTYISNISQNNINNNKRNGINLNNKTEKTYITHNIISKNANGVQINGLSINLIITLNTIKEQRKTVSTNLDKDETGNGIVIGDGYNPSSTQLIEYNYISDNEGFGVKNKPQFDVMEIGANYYGEGSSVPFCPRILASMLTAKLSISGETELWDGKKKTGYNFGPDGIYSLSNNDFNEKNSDSYFSNSSKTNINGKIEDNKNISSGNINNTKNREDYIPTEYNSTYFQSSVGESGDSLSKAYELISNEISRAEGDNSIVPYLILIIIVIIFIIGYFKKKDK